MVHLNFNKHKKSAIFCVTSSRNISFVIEPSEARLGKFRVIIAIFKALQSGIAIIAFLHKQ